MNRWMCDGLFIHESTGHPTKMAGGLLFRIPDEGEARECIRATACNSPAS